MENARQFRCDWNHSIFYSLIISHMIRKSVRGLIYSSHVHELFELFMGAMFSSVQPHTVGLSMQKYKCM